MLGLLTPTDPEWVEAVEGDLDRLLSDHAHCELKAAQTALSLAGQYGGRAPGIVEPLVSLSQEETGHFHQVHRRIVRRGGTLASTPPDPYVRALHRSTDPERGEVPRLLDRLLVAALIEARSCERFKLLADRLRTAELCHFYRELMESEARHHRLFTRLAEKQFGAGQARERLHQLAAREAHIAASLPLGPTVHG